MWGLYADSGKGLVFEFDHQKLKKGNQEYYCAIDYILQINKFELIKNYIINSIEMKDKSIQSLFLSKSDHCKFKE